MDDKVMYKQEYYKRMKCDLQYRIYQLQENLNISFNRMIRQIEDDQSALYDDIEIHFKQIYSLEVDYGKRLSKMVEVKAVPIELYNLQKLTLNTSTNLTSELVELYELLSEWYPHVKHEIAMQCTDLEAIFKLARRFGYYEFKCTRQ